MAATLFLNNYHDPEMVFSDFTLPHEDQVSQDSDYQMPLKVNIVFLGLDQTEQVERFGRQSISHTVQPDTIIFATLEIRNRQAKVISISRDSKVPIVGYGVADKINHAYRYGVKQSEDLDDQARVETGISATLDTVENLMGTPVDFYITIDIDGLIKIVDIMGGVYYYVENDIRADLGQGRVLIEKGYQHLDGEHFFYYVQYRDVYDRHHARMERQQQILKSAFHQFRSTGKLSKIPAVLNVLRNNIKTNLSSRHIGALLRFARELDLEDVTFYSFEGEGMFTEYGYFFYIDEEQRVAVLKEILDVEVDSLGITKGVPIDPEADDQGTETNLFQVDFWDNNPLLVDLDINLKID